MLGSRLTNDMQQKRQLSSNIVSLYERLGSSVLIGLLLFREVVRAWYAPLRYYAATSYRRSRGVHRAVAWNVFYGRVDNEDDSVEPGRAGAAAEARHVTAWQNVRLSNAAESPYVP